MTPTPSSGEHVTAGRGATGRLGLVAVFLALGGFYLAVVSGGFYRFNPRLSYYDMLGDAFLSGHTYLKPEPSPELVSAFERKDYEHLGNQDALLDTALYHGKFYVYFGPTPALVCAAWKGATGRPCQSLPLNLLFTLVSAGALFAALTTLDLLSGGGWPAGRWFVFLTFALGAIQLYVVAIPEIYELAIGAGMCFTLCAYAAFLRYLADARRPVRLLVVTGLFLALAISSRVVTIFYAGAIGLVLAWTERQGSASLTRSIGRLAAFAAPIAGAGVGLLIYNWERFGNLLDFGVAHTLTTAPSRAVIDAGRLFSVGNILPNLRWYFLHLPPASVHFPFLSLEASDGFHFHSSSAFLTTPLIVLTVAAVCWLVAGRLRRSSPVATAALAIGGLGAALCILCFFGATKRYEYDFLPVWFVLAYVGLREVRARWPPTPVWRAAGRIALGALGAWSVAVGILLGLTAAALDFPPYLQAGHWSRRVRAVVLPASVVPVDLQTATGYPPDLQRMALDYFRATRVFLMAWGGVIEAKTATLEAGTYDVDLEHFSYYSTPDHVCARFYAWVEADGRPLVELTDRRLWESDPNGKIDRVSAFYLPIPAAVRVKISYVNDTTGSLSDRNLFLSAMWLRRTSTGAGTLWSQLDLRQLSGYPPEQNAQSVAGVSRGGAFVMAWQGAVTSPPVSVVPGVYELIVAHSGTPAAGVFPHFSVSIGSVDRGTLRPLVTQEFDSAKDVRGDRVPGIRVDAPSDLSITVAYLNDVGSPEDRNLYLHGLYLIKR